MPTIYPMMPFRRDMNLGRAYNDFMSLLPKDGWACFLDHDMMFTTKHWYEQLEEAIDFAPKVGALAAMTNRIARTWQQAGDPDNNDIAYHRSYGEKRRETRTLLDVTPTRGFGGVMLCLSKAAWEAVDGFAEGLGCVDHSMHFKLAKAGYRNYLIEGLYVFHWRHYGDKDPTETAAKAPNCPCCSGLFELPKLRLRLP